MKDLEETRGAIFNIQHYSIHDGPGIRTTVFLKGCPLRCFWCQNPESQVIQPVIFFNAEKCTGCGRCVDTCPEGAISVVGDRSKTNRDLCKGDGRCAEVCPAEARNLMGRFVTAGEVFKEVNEDRIFYQNSGGGVTLSGGDPVAQPDFSLSILKLCKDAGMHTALDTCGFAKWETLKKLLENTDLVLYDFKHMNPDVHRRYTGVSNELILENARRICFELKLPMLARIPVIPGYNDSEENLAMTAEFISANLGDGVRVHLLPYHKLGQTKYERMEEAQKVVPVEPPSDEYMETLRGVFLSFGVSATVGG